MIRRLAKTVVLSVALAATAHPALAQDRAAAVRDACAKDIATHCPTVQPGNGRVAACFKDNMTKLTEGCRTALKSNAVD